MADLCIGVKDLLLDAEVSNYLGSGDNDSSNPWFTYLGKTPAKPYTTITVLESGGQPPNPKFLLDYPSIQIMVRGDVNGLTEAKAKAKEIKDVLLGFESADVNGDRWIAVNMIGDINPLGFDSNNCPLFSLNFSLIVAPATNNLTNRVSL